MSNDSKQPNQIWRLHDAYEPGVSTTRIVTRSQTPFIRIKHTKSNLALFSDARFHKIPDHPHLMEVLKGTYGAIPRTIITRSTGVNLKHSPELEEMLKPFKDYHKEELLKVMNNIVDEEVIKTEKEEPKEEPKEEEEDQKT